jgi:hypothetical protein
MNCLQATDCVGVSRYRDFVVIQAKGSMGLLRIFVEMDYGAKAQRKGLHYFAFDTRHGQCSKSGCHVA